MRAYQPEDYGASQSLPSDQDGQLLSPPLNHKTKNSSSRGSSKLKAAK